MNDSDVSRPELLPPAELQADVSGFCILEEPQNIYNQDEIIPDPYVELVINCGAPVIQYGSDGSRVELPAIFINGLQSRPRRLEALGRCQFIAVRMHPWALRHFRDDVTILHGTDGLMTILDGTWNAAAAAARWAAAHQGYEQAVGCLQEFMIRSFRGTPHDVTPIHQAANLLHSTRGQLRIHELAAQCFLSPSQLERRFKQVTRVSPKTYARLVRFSAVVYRLILNPDSSTLRLAQDLGFTDQAHLIHEFRVLAGQTPGEFAASTKTVSARYRWRRIPNLPEYDPTLGAFG